MLHDEQGYPNDAEAVLANASHATTALRSVSGSAFTGKYVAAVPATTA
jgi:hypothetical protein